MWPLHIYSQKVKNLTLCLVLPMPSRDSMYINTAWRHLFTCSRLCLQWNVLLRLQMATDMERLASFEEAYYDQYDYYNLIDYSCHAGGKGRSKKEVELNTNRHSPAGHERKIAEKYHNSQVKRRRTKSSSTWRFMLSE